MAVYIFRRLVISLVLAFVAATLIFLLLRVVPGDVVDAMLADGGASPEQVEIMREQMGLNEPVLRQYVTWFGNLLRGDLGESLISGRSVTMDLTSTFPRTIELILVATFMAWLIGVPAGVVAAARRNKPSDFIISTASLVGLSVPIFVTAALLILVFSLQLEWLRPSGFTALRDDPIEHLKLLLLPCIAIAVSFAGVLMRMTRASLLETLGNDYIRTAKGKGLSDRIVLYRHALRNSLIPVVTASGLQMGQLLGGTVIVEYVFNYPGMSTMLIDAVQRRDYPVVQGALLMISLAFILINLVIDVINAQLDPRIRKG